MHVGASLLCCLQSCLVLLKNFERKWNLYDALVHSLPHLIRDHLPAQHQHKLQARANPIAVLLQGGQRTVLLTAFMEKGDLYNALGRSPVRYSWHHYGQQIALDVARGLEYLHSCHIVHFECAPAGAPASAAQSSA